MIIYVCSEDNVSLSQRPSTITILYMIIERWRGEVEWRMIKNVIILPGLSIMFTRHQLVNYCQVILIILASLNKPDLVMSFKSSNGSVMVVHSKVERMKGNNILKNFMGKYFEKQCNGECDSAVIMQKQNKFCILLQTISVPQTFIF